jgi:hypothetical protein
MSLRSIIVGFEAPMLEVRRTLSHLLGADPAGARLLGLHLELYDMSEAYAFADAYLRMRGIDESNSFLREFDIAPFANELHLSWSAGRALAGLGLHAADVLAREASSALDTRVLIRISDGEVPFRLYEKGTVTRDYRDEYGSLIAGEDWLPKRAA